jgi:hypothetical protein
MKKIKKAMTAAEALTSMRSDPEFVRRAEEREQNRKAVETRLAGEERNLLADLAAVGFDVGSVWELVNSPNPYPSAIPILCKHLSLPYDTKIREGIARALTVREARGTPGRIILTELQRPVEQSPRAVRWALANALTVAGDVSMIEQLESHIADPRFGDVREILKLAVQKISAK